MAVASPSPAMELSAAKLTIEWKDQFAGELIGTARELARETGLVTTTHLHQALPAVMSRLQQLLEGESRESADRP